MDRGPGRAALARGSKGGFGDGGRQNGAHSNPDTGRGYSAKLAGRTVFRERHRSIPVSGTDGSNPSPSSSESYLQRTAGLRAKSLSLSRRSAGVGT